jgi:hypothetical protein
MFTLEFLSNRYINVSLICEELSKRKSKKILFKNWISNEKIISYLESINYSKDSIIYENDIYYVHKHIIQIFFLFEFKEYFEEISSLIDKSESEYLKEIIKAKDKNIRSLKSKIDDLEEFRAKYVDEKHILEEKLKSVNKELTDLKMGIEKKKESIDIHF